MLDVPFLIDCSVGVGRKLGAGGLVCRSGGPSLAHWNGKTVPLAKSRYTHQLPTKLPKSYEDIERSNPVFGNKRLNPIGGCLHDLGDGGHGLFDRSGEFGAACVAG